MQKIMWALMVLMTAIFHEAYAADTYSTWDEELLKKSFVAVIGHEKPTEGAVLDKALTANDMGRAKMPNHNPSFQFSQQLSSVSCELELALIYRNLYSTDGDDVDSERQRLLDKLEPWSFGDVKLGDGIVNLGIISESEMLPRIQQLGASSSILIVKFAHPAWKGNRALVYAEAWYVNGKYKSELLHKSGVGEGIGLSFKRLDGEWKLTEQHTLWQGGPSF
ncbi:hypothetical protein [Sideroxydans sp. CL21]|uniref:hypothetical protein n=1 Tax=Sideroxydans sp. CL21 TaxID=2600596 RepID=UPI0024BD1972|nr:hypothetical protein [Sideroxydans sp. CL21]